jgi:hypothetical protein
MRLLNIQGICKISHKLTAGVCFCVYSTQGSTYLHMQFMRHSFNWKFAFIVYLVESCCVYVNLPAALLRFVCVCVCVCVCTHTYTHTHTHNMYSIYMLLNTAVYAGTSSILHFVLSHYAQYTWYWYYSAVGCWVLLCTLQGHNSECLYSLVTSLSVVYILSSLTNSFTRCKLERLVRLHESSAVAIWIYQNIACLCIVHTLNAVSARIIVIVDEGFRMHLL